MMTQLILALDVDSLKKAKYLVNKLYPQVKIFKVGPVLFTSAGPKIVEYIHKKGAQVFLDLKFHDIPNTVGNSVLQAARLKVKMLTLHISGEEDMVRAAVRSVKGYALKNKARQPLLIGVTVLTSQKANSVRVLRLARKGISWGLDGLVCSVKEVGVLRKKIREDFITVTPGIRFERGLDDQKRTATVYQAKAAGADFIVVGRPILDAKDPLEVVDEINSILR